MIILKILESKTNSTFEKYEIARKIESYKRFFSFYGTIPILGFCFFIFISQFIDFFFNEHNRNVPPSTFLPTLIITPIIAVFFFYILYKIFKLYRAAKNLKGLDVLQGEYKDLIDQRLKDIINKLSLNDEKNKLRNCAPQYLIEKDNYSATPSMIVSSGRPNIIFPLGYFKAVMSNSEAADAMLAHELAHYLHKDSNFLLWVRCYYKSIHKFTYMVLIYVAIKLIFEPNLFITLSIFAFLAFILQELIMLFLRRRVEFAEELADVFAAIAVSPQAVSQFLKDYIVDGNKSYEMDSDEQSLHPPISRRIQIAENLSRSLEKSLSLK